VSWKFQPRRLGNQTMMIWMRITLITVLIISSGSATYASGQPSYIISSSKVPQLNPIKYEIAFVSRFDNRIVVDSGAPGPSVDDVIAGSGTLWDKKGVQIGRFDANTRVSEKLKDGDKRLLFVNYSFGDGQDSIVILGVGTYAGTLGLMNQQVTNTFSIVGGTGKFLAAGGQCQITRIDQINYQLSCTALTDY
jgi:hypothetical protein